MKWHFLFSRFSKQPPATLTDELRREMRACFDKEASAVSTTIEPWRVSHGEFLFGHLGDLNGKRVLDAGCGKGRFGRFLSERNPEASIWGVDISRKMLRHVPASMNVQLAWMTELPFVDSAFDAAYAIESLEHAVEIEIAIRELCRVVKPGGRIVIIDKNAEQIGRFRMPYWERWFRRSDLEDTLRRYATSVSSQFLPHITPQDPLFIGWTAEKAEAKRSDVTRQRPDGAMEGIRS